MTATERPEMSFDDAVVVPERVGRGDTATARRVLDRDGAVILGGWPAEPDGLVAAAADALGTRLRELERVRIKTTQEGNGQGLHRDGSNVVIDIGDRRVQLRHPDIDYLLIGCATPAPAGGATTVVDGYRLLDRLRRTEPGLYEFLTTVDVNLTARNPSPDIHPVPRVSRLVEWTRGGRIIVRTGQHASPVPRETQWESHQAHIDAWTAFVDAAGSTIRDPTVLQTGEILLLDNYRCLHGVTAHGGARTVHILACITTDAR